MDWALSFDLKALDDYEHGLVPYTAILLQCLEQWKSTHGGKYPSTFAEKQQFIDLIKSNARNYKEQENFQEAVTFVYKCYQDPADLPYKLTEVLGSERTKNANESSDEFWIFAKALSMFIEKHKLPPLKGGCPDQHASTTNFLTLKRM